MQDAIILYENGKAIGGEGHPTNASDITFDNTGTDLVAETAQAAIVEVNEKTKHGVVELWKNSSPSTSFAGQTINITAEHIYDAFMIELGSGSDVYLLISCESTGHAYPVIFNMAGNGKIYSHARSITASETTIGYDLAISDNTYRVLNSYATTPTSSTDNANIIPLRIFGIIHND